MKKLAAIGLTLLSALGMARAEGITGSITAGGTVSLSTANSCVFYSIGATDNTGTLITVPNPATGNFGTAYMKPDVQAGVSTNPVATIVLEIRCNVDTGTQVIFSFPSSVTLRRSFTPGGPTYAPALNPLISHVPTGSYSSPILVSGDFLSRTVTVQFPTSGSGAPNWFNIPSGTYTGTLNLLVTF